jgi:hypothetical protein
MATLQPIDTRAIFAQSLLQPRPARTGIEAGAGALSQVIGAMLLKKASVRRQEQIDLQDANVTKAFQFIESGDRESLAGIAGDLPSSMRATVASFLTSKGAETFSQVDEETLEKMGIELPSNRYAELSSTGALEFKEIFKIEDEFNALTKEEAAAKGIEQIPGHEILFNKRNGKFQYVGVTPPEGFRLATDAERTAAGFPDTDAGFAVYMNKVTGKPATFRRVALQPGDVPDPPVEETAIRKAYGEERGKILARLEQATNDFATEAINETSRLDVFEAALSGFETGSFAGVRASAARLIDFFGGDPGEYDILRADTAMSADVLKAYHNRLTIDVASSDVFEGNLNKDEIRILEDSVVGLSKTREGNAMLIEARRFAGRHAIEKANFMEDYLTSGGKSRVENIEGLPAKLRDWEVQNNAFPQEFLDRIDAAGKVPVSEPGHSGTSSDGRKFTSDDATFMGWDDQTGFAIFFSKEGVQYNDSSHTKPGFVRP